MTQKYSEQNEKCYCSCLNVIIIWKTLIYDSFKRKRLMLLGCPGNTDIFIKV